jgi:tetratricopeptide (TPR) repeat protein
MLDNLRHTAGPYETAHMTDLQARYTQAAEAFQRRNWSDAKKLATGLLPNAPLHPGLHYMAGIACLETGNVTGAIHHLRQATALDPRHANALAHYARALGIARSTRESLAVAEEAVALDPKDPATLNILAVVFSQANAHTQAADLFGRVVASAPTHAPFRFNLATALLFCGDLEGAERELEACVHLAPTFWRAHFALSHLRRQTAENNHVKRLQGWLAQTSEPGGLLNLHLALAKEYEDLGQFPLALEHFTEGKRAGKPPRNYSSRQDEALFNALIEAFPEPVEMPMGEPSSEPFFVVGMPRSGTTLVERILASHPDVYAAGELQNFGTAVKRASGSHTPMLLDASTIAQSRKLDWRQLGSAYLASTRPATGHTRHFIDKLPHNFLYLGHIARALPNARILCVRRHPMDTCLGNFRQLFSTSSPYYDYSFDLLDIGRYYVCFDRLMTHWQAVLPGRILTVRYEDVVGDLEGQARRLLAACGLTWNQDCLRFQDNPEPVATASAAQVRSPIYRHAIGRWHRYGEAVEPLRELLERNGIEI